MALTTAQKLQSWKDCMASMSRNEQKIGLNKNDLRTALDSLNDYVESNYSDTMWDSIITTENVIDSDENVIGTQKVFTYSNHATTVNQFNVDHKIGIRTQVLGLSIFTDQADLDVKIPKATQKYLLKDLLNKRLKTYIGG